MTHEPKVGELPALPDLPTPHNLEIGLYAVHQMQAYARRYAAQALEAEREARKDEARVDRMENALHQISHWAQAYPLDVFPEPDFKKAHEVLEVAGISLGAVAASSMRHVITQVQAIVNAALQAEQPEGS